jgi:hypothetical protein
MSSLTVTFQFFAQGCNAFSNFSKVDTDLIIHISVTEVSNHVILWTTVSSTYLRETFLKFGETYSNEWQKRDSILRAYTYCFMGT